MIQRNVQNLLDWLYCKGFIRNETQARNYLLFFEPTTTILRPKPIAGVLILACLAFIMYATFVAYPLNTPMTYYVLAQGITCSALGLFCVKQAENAPIHWQEPLEYLGIFFILLAKLSISIGVATLLAGMGGVSLAFYAFISLLALSVISFFTVSNFYDNFFSILTLLIILSLYVWTQYPIEQVKLIAYTLFGLTSILLMSWPKRYVQHNLLLYLSISITFLLALDSVLHAPTLWQTLTYENFGLSDYFAAGFLLGASLYACIKNPTRCIHILCITIIFYTYGFLHPQYFLLFTLLMLSSLKLEYIICGFCLFLLALLLSLQLYYIELLILYKFILWISIGLSFIIAHKLLANIVNQ